MGSIDNRHPAYQGEIIGKSQIFNRFKESVAKIEQGMISLNDHPWEDMKLILKMIFNEAARFENYDDPHLDF